MNKKQQGFTLIELLIVIAIIGILASIVLVSLSNAKQSAKDANAFSVMKSVQSVANHCLFDGAVQRLGYVGGSGIYQYICADAIRGLESGGWPALNGGWSFGGLPTGGMWCDPRIDISTVSDGCGAYANGTCGGFFNKPDFCFGARNGSKYILCTEQGCKKIGF